MKSVRPLNSQIAFLIRYLHFSAIGDAVCRPVDALADFGLMI